MQADPGPISGHASLSAGSSCPPRRPSPLDLPKFMLKDGDLECLVGVRFSLVLIWPHPQQ